MSHDELLATLDKGIKGWEREGRDTLALDIIRAVVELHKPEHSIRGYRCTWDDEAFPCKHHQAIEKELK